jgi:YbgC/YbaW family acyl-CoA thioester hydrolase
MKKPISYSAEVLVRFADLDPYGHVNATNYLDYIVTARWHYAKERFGATDRTFIDKGIGFFVTRAELLFKRPIVGVQPIIARSHIREIAEAKLWAPYEITSKDGKTVFSEGTLEFAVIDLKSNRPTACPDWVHPYFFEEA